MKLVFFWFHCLGRSKERRSSRAVPKQLSAVIRKFQRSDINTATWYFYAKIIISSQQDIITYTYMRLAIWSLKTVSKRLRVIFKSLI